jgi:hypothetical protein
VRRGEEDRSYHGKIVKRDLKGWDISRDLYLDRSAWKTAIDVPEL